MPNNFKNENWEYNSITGHRWYYETWAVMPSLKVKYNDDIYNITHEENTEYPKKSSFNTNYTITKNWETIYTFQVNTITDDPFKNFVVDKYGRRLLYYKNPTEKRTSPQLIRNGENFSENYWYRDVFNLTSFWPNQQTFFFYKRNKIHNPQWKISYYFDGKTYETQFDEIIHDKCCEPASFNIKNWKNGEILFRGIQNQQFSYNQGKLNTIDKKRKINGDWSNEKLTCHYYNYWEDKNTEKQKDIEEIRERIWKENEQYEFQRYFWWWGRIEEYCTNADKTKIIGYGHGKSPYKFILWDKKNDFFQLTTENLNILNDIPRPRNAYRNDSSPLFKYYQKYLQSKKKINGFGKKQGQHIKFTTYAIPFHQSGLSAKKTTFLKQKTIRRCENGLTSWGNPSICFINAHYDWNLNKNTITEEKVCVYSIRDNGEIYLIRCSK